MNKNDKKAHRGTRGLIDPRSIKEFKVYKSTTLLDFLFFKMPDLPKKTVKGLLSHHQVAVGGVPISQFDYPLYEEDVVTVSKNRIAKRESKGLKVLFEDEDIIAIDKPSGLLSVASVLVFAKNIETREALQNAWQDIVSKRGYYAIVEGTMEKEEGTLKDYLYQDNFQLVRVSKTPGKGKLAITNYRLVKSNNGLSLLDVNIDSGRKNQIRVQLGHIGHHVIGDDKYGEPVDPLKRLGLHAYELAFVNPLTKKEYDLVSPMPETFKSLFFEKKKPLSKPKAVARDTRAMTKIKKGQQRRKRR